MSASGLDDHDLKQWHKEYMAANGNKLSYDSPIVTAVNQDPIDHTAIDKAIQHAMALTHISEGFCDNCRQLFNNWPDLGSKSWEHAIGRHFRTTDVEAASRLGCACCTVVLGQLKETGQLNTFRRIERRLEHLNDSGAASISISNWSSDDAQLLWMNLPGKVATGCNNPCAVGNKFQSHVVPPSHYHKQNMDPIDAAIGWFRTCAEQHEPCRIVDQERRPSRLISVTNDSVKLVSTTDWETMPRYATLSYSWGSGDFIKLTSDTIDSYLVNIPLQDLPATFRDAIYIARKLGLEYIWIDALCIIQSTENNDDWLKEAGLMRYVYGSTYMNIAASSASSVHDGCFSKPADFCGGFLARVETPQHCRVRNFHTHDVYQDATTRTHLATRAWALQEKLLAPRTLYLGERGLFWECRCTTASEFLPAGFPGRLGKQLVRAHDEAWPWSDIVQHYSRAHLTHGSDRLPAIAGIARRQAELTGDGYLAGMWRDRLVKQLGWAALAKLPRPAWRAPTWSWVSVDGGAHYWGYWNHDDLAKTEYVSVVRAETSLAGPDAFGPVTGGELSLACTALIPAQYCQLEVEKRTSPDKSVEDYVTLETGGFPLPIRLDCWEIDPIKYGDSLFLLPLFAGDSGMGITLAKPTGDVPNPESSEDGHFSERLIRGVVLQPVGLPPGTFQRVGSFDFGTFPRFSEDWPSSMPNDAPSLLSEDLNPALKFYNLIFRAMDEVGVATAESNCVGDLSTELDSEKRYLINIV